MVYAVIWMHFVSDFILQSDRMAKGKSTSIKWLSIHIAAYTAPFLILGWRYALANGGAHWVIDYFTSKGTSALWKKGEVHWFFVLIGFDQALHLSLLVALLPLVRLP